MWKTGFVDERAIEGRLVTSAHIPGGRPDAPRAWSPFALWVGWGRRWSGQGHGQIFISEWSARIAYTSDIYCAD